jgi:hypothetical protein
MNKTRAPRWLGLVGALGGVVALFATSVTPAAASDSAPSPHSSGISLTTPLEGAITTSGATWATVLMGKNDGDHDLFWQLFVSAPNRGWTLVTPPGVADNGGLITAPNPSGTTVLVGFGASQGLAFSPLALTSTTGKTWAQGGLAEALLPMPSAMALSPADRALALVNGNASSGAKRVLVQAGNLTSWKTLVTERDLASTSAGKSCGVASLDAVGFGQGNEALVGASCRQLHAPGVFVDSGGAWHLADIVVPSGLIDDSFSVVRLGASSALFLAGEGQRADVVAGWGPLAGQRWKLSPPLPLGTKGQLVASGMGSGTSQFVVTRDNGVLRAAIVAGPGAAWRTLPHLPQGTQTVAVGASGRLDALAVSDTKLGVWQLDTGKANWVKVQSITVPIVFGSSS